MNWGSRWLAMATQEASRLETAENRGRQSSQEEICCCFHRHNYINYINNINNINDIIYHIKVVIYTDDIPSIYELRLHFFADSVPYDHVSSSIFSACLATRTALIFGPFRVFRPLGCTGWWVYIPWIYRSSVREKVFRWKKNQSVCKHP